MTDLIELPFAVAAAPAPAIVHKARDNFPGITEAELFRRFIPASQYAAFQSGLRSEEGDAFREIRARLTGILRTMPLTGATEGESDPVAWLHYFRGGYDAYITELDKGAPDDTDEEFQWQMFGSANLGYGAELGYINLPELRSNHVELDFHFTPKRLSELEK